MAKVIEKQKLITWAKVKKKFTPNFFKWACRFAAGWKYVYNRTGWYELNFAGEEYLIGWGNYLDSLPENFAYFSDFITRIIDGINKKGEVKITNHNTYMEFSNGKYVNLFRFDEYKKSKFFPAELLARVDCLLKLYQVSMGQPSQKS